MPRQDQKKRKKLENSWIQIAQDMTAWRSMKESSSR